jgi:hypothetical protein
MTIYLRCGLRKRDDAAEMRKYRPDWSGKRPPFLGNEEFLIEILKYYAILTS